MNIVHPIWSALAIMGVGELERTTPDYFLML